MLLMAEPQSGQRKKKKKDKNEIEGDVFGTDLAFNDSSVYSQSLQYRIQGIRTWTVA